MAKKEKEAGEVVYPAIGELIGARLTRLQSGKANDEDIKALRRALDEAPEFWGAVGNMATEARRSIIRQTAADNTLVSEAMSHGCKAISHRLGHDESPMLEQLLIEAVILAWLRWSVVELHYSAAHRQELSIERADYWDRHLNAAQRRYLRALTALARVRKMDLPALQINIGGQQVNIAGR